MLRLQRRDLRCASYLVAVGGFLVVAASATPAVAASPQAKCRAALHRAAGKYFKTAAAVFGDCHAAQARGDVAPLPLLDCNDSATWNPAYAPGPSRLAAAAGVFRRAIAACTKSVVAGPSLLALSACPSPCDAAHPSLAAFEDVARCLQCLTDACVADVADDGFGASVLLDPTANRDLLRCRDQIGDQIPVYGYKRNLLQGKCQLNRDRARRGYEDVDCSDLSAASNPFSGKAADQISRFERAIVAACGNNNILAEADGCGYDTVSTTLCVRAAIDRCVDSLHGMLTGAGTGVEPSPTPSPTTITSPTPSASPSITGASPTPTVTPTPPPPSTVTVTRTGAATGSPTPDGLGAPCSSDADCNVGSCSPDGVCCDRSCSATCEACLGAKTGGVDGVCRAIVSDSDPDAECNDDNPCTLDTCDGNGACQFKLRAAGTACGGVTSSCLIADTCDAAGNCLAGGFAVAGTVCGDDGNPCTDDVCDGTGGCQHINNIAPCDDGVFCNGSDSCNAGVCSVHAGDPCPGADGDANCSETCDENAAACIAPDPAGSSCDDGLFCNGSEVCNAGGQCVAVGDEPCPAGGLFGGDDDADCRESCDEFTNTCGAADPDGTPCNDATADSDMFCTGGDVGNPCSDDSECTSGSCVAVCSGRDAGKECAGDGDCRDGGTCSARACASPEYSINGAIVKIAPDSCRAGVCIGGAPPCAGDAHDALGRGLGLSASCGDACNETSNLCDAPVNDGFDCRNDSFCDGNQDSCHSGVCTPSGDPCAVHLADGDANCSEACNEQTACSGYGCFGTGSCTAPEPDGSRCSDGSYCNGSDTCSAGVCSVHAGDPCPLNGFVVGDNDGDCSESCVDNPSDPGPGAPGDASYHCNGSDPNGSSCNDGTFCNGADTCNAGVCSNHAGDPCLVHVGDADNDCSESCNETSDDCTLPDPNGSSCADGVFCNGTDTCSAGSCSIHSGNPCPGHNVGPLCNDSCSEVNDSCTAPDQAATSCNDGLFCNGTDTCNGSGSCAHSGDPCPGPDGDGNCSESCNESSDTCTAPDPNGTSCTDGLFCNGTDTCNAGSCSAHTGDPCAGPDGDGNCSESCNESSDNCTAPDPNGTSCTDGLFCNGTDTCNAGACSVHAGNPCPGHNVGPDCNDSCRESNDTCTANDQNGTSCTDNLFCNGADTCNSGSCANHAGNPCPGPDNDANCRESCNETGDACNANDPTGASCNDGDPYTVNDQCSGSNTCVGEIYHVLAAINNEQPILTPGRQMDALCSFARFSIFGGDLGGQCTQVHALVSVNSSDTIRNMPTTFGFNANRSIRSISGASKYGDNWNDLVDGSWDQNLTFDVNDGGIADQGLFTLPYWTGSDRFGNLGSNHCDNWTVKNGTRQANHGGNHCSTIFGDDCTHPLWHGSTPCDGSAAYLCLCVR